MAARLRAQLAALTADLSANKVSLSGTQTTLSSTQTTLSSTQSTVTLTSSGLTDVSSNLYRVAQFDASSNATLSNINNLSLGNKVSLSVDASKNLVIDANSILFSSKPIFVDKFTLPEPIGPYEVESIPIVIQDKFGLPKFSCNKTGDDVKYTKTVIGNNGASVAIDFSNNKWTNYKFDTRVAPEMVVYVPSVRTKTQRVYSNMFRDGVDGSGSTPTLGSNACALDDTLLYAVRGLQQTGSASLDAAVTALKNSLRNPTTTASARKALYNTMVNHADYKAIQANMKTPIKIWDHVPITDASGYRNFQFDPLNQLTTDISNNGVAIPIQNTLQDGSKWTVQVTRSAWESTLDASGIPTQMLPVAQNINATTPGYDTTYPAVQSSNSKMGLWINFSGQTSNCPADNSNAYQIASLGYVAIWCHSNPILGGYHRYQGRNTVANVLANKNTDASAVPYKTYDICGNAMTDASGCFMDVSNALYNSHVLSPANIFSSPDGLDSSNNAITGSDCCRLLGRYYPNSEPIAEMYERYMYEIKCVLNKLGIGQFINYNNVIYQGLSAGGSIISSLHNTIVESTDASGFITGVTGTNSGVSRYFQCNDNTGEKVSKKPFLAIPKALFNYQMVIADANNVKDMIFDTNRAFYPNSRHTLSMTKLKIPMICFTGEYDISNRDNSTTTPIVDNKYNRAAQLVFQNTNKYIVDNGATIEQNTQLVIAKSVAIMRPNTGHNPQMNPYVEKNDGELSYDFTSGLGNYIKGWEIPLNISLPNLSLYDRGIQSELSYVTQSDLKLGYAFYIMAHRFLGDDFPVPPHALETLGLKYIIAPLNLNIPNDSEYLRVGPKSIVSYDASNNLEMTTPGLVIKSVTYKNGPNTYKTPNSQIDTINMTPVGQAKITVDASKNLVTDAIGITFAGLKITTDSLGNIVFS